MSEKTDGQLLYEAKNPSHLLVIEFSKRTFGTRDEAFLTPNPVHHTEWKFLTKECQQKWETLAVGHHLVVRNGACAP